MRPPRFAPRKSDQNWNSLCWVIEIRNFAMQSFDANVANQLSVSTISRQEGSITAHERWFSVSIALIALLLSPLQAASISETVKRRIQQRVDYGYNPGVIIGIVDASGRDYYSYGRIDLEQDESPNEHTVYEIGSVTKVFTTSLLAEMVARGEVTLSDPVADLLPEGTAVPERRGRPITLTHLANHSSALPANPPEIVENNPLNPFIPYPESTLFRFLETYELTRSPGSEFEYSNLGMGLLGYALAQHLGTPYETALTDRILTPLGLTDTTITPTPDHMARRAPGYNGVLDRPPFEMDTLGAAGVLLSTADNLLTFLEHQLDLKSSPLNPTLASTHTATRSLGTPGQSIGLGWIRIDLGTESIVMHDGATMGHNSFAGFNPETKTGVVVLTNNRINEYAAIQDLGLHSLSSQIPLASVRRTPTVSTEDLQRLVGHYETDDGTAFDFRLQRGQLVTGYSEDQGLEFTLYPQSPLRFQLYETGVTASALFSTDDSGRVTSMEWRQSDERTTFQRIRQQPTLALTRRDQTLRLSVTGEGDTPYVIEQSTDLNQWTTLREQTVWDPPIEIRTTSDSEAAFYRIRP
jgi:serine-type D-Ala-D-Ala carboxypeptidase/endopeptidase